MKICFWGDIAGALNDNTSGGGELQISLLARALAKMGHEVVVLECECAEGFETKEGIKVYPIKGWTKGIRMIRTLTHKLPYLYLCLRDQKADIYYCRIRNYRHIFAYWAARKVNAKFILGLASDLDIMDFRTRWKYFYLTNMRKLWVFFEGLFSEIVYPWLIRKSDYIFVQHIGQKEILLRKNISSVLFPNLIDLSERPLVSNAVKKDFIYVGWLDKRKGFKEFFHLVEKAPLHSFKVVGPPRDKIGFFYYDKLKTFKNVSLLGELSHSETMYHIANSKALISTSPMEGFPNIFIEAWAFGIPVLSLYFDPGGVIRREGLGEVANGNLDKLLDAMNSLRNTEEFSDRAKAYVENNHVLNAKKTDEINSLFNELVNNRKA
jgi:Glycosyl transferases group 1